MTRILSGTLGVLVIASAMLIAPDQSAQANGNVWHCDRQDVAAIPLVETEISGSAKLCATPWGLYANMRLKNVTPDYAYTVWWVYVDNPAECTDGAGNFGPQFCAAPANFGGDNPLVVFGRMDSAIPARGREHFNGSLRDFIPSPGSQVILLTFGHGPADFDDRRHLARQLLTPEDPMAGAPHLGIIGGPLGYPVSFAVFTVP